VRKLPAVQLRMAGIAVLAALGGGAAVAAVGFGDGSSRGPDATPTSITAHRVSAPSSLAKGVTAKSASTKLIYKETPPRTVTNTPMQKRYTVGKCPRGSGAINGYYLADNFDMASVGGGPTPSARKWELDVVVQTSGQAIFGVICLRP
jgi:hypothetical protein